MFCCMKSLAKTMAWSGADQWTLRGGEAHSQVDCVNLELLCLKGCPKPGSLNPTPGTQNYRGTMSPSCFIALLGNSRKPSSVLPFRAPLFFMVALWQWGHLWLMEAGLCAGLGTSEDNILSLVSGNIGLYCSTCIIWSLTSFSPLQPKSIFTCKF